MQVCASEGTCVRAVSSHRFLDLLSPVAAAAGAVAAAAGAAAGAAAAGETAAVSGDVSVIAVAVWPAAAALAAAITAGLFSYILSRSFIVSRP